jgi:hypothetical protein
MEASRQRQPIHSCPDDAFEHVRVLAAHGIEDEHARGGAAPGASRRRSEGAAVSTHIIVFFGAFDATRHAVDSPVHGLLEAANELVEPPSRNGEFRSPRL